MVVVVLLLLRLSLLACPPSLLLRLPVAIISFSSVGKGFTPRAPGPQDRGLDEKPVVWSARKVRDALRGNIIGPEDSVNDNLTAKGNIFGLLREGGGDKMGKVYNIFWRGERRRGGGAIVGCYELYDCGRGGGRRYSV